MTFRTTASLHKKHLAVVTILMFVIPYGPYGICATRAQAAQPELKTYSVKLEHLANRAKGSTEELSWDSKTSKCQGRYDSLPWKPLPQQSCQDLAEAFKTNHAALIALQKSPPKQAHSTLHQPRGLLTWSDAGGTNEWAVDLATAPVCTDPELKNCHEPQLDQASTLTKKLRELLTQTLGRLPLPGNG